uniref:Mitochondrial ribosomal protein S18C n=1 Tax=Timema monikensis TaxID=170555 RepID=A0A7R9HM44_9NEOP|nr:unnamed protein product [Timema monikensis]
MTTERDTRHLTYHSINRGATRSYSDLALLHNCNAVDCTGKLRGLSAQWTVRRLSSSLSPLQYPELDEKIVAARQKDMPISDMPNPFEREKAQCILCRLKLTPDYKNAKLLSQFVSPYTGRIYGRHITGLCLRQQQMVEEEIIKSQNVGFMAYYLKQVEFLHDPKLFDPERPIRNHRF